MATSKSSRSTAKKETVSALTSDSGKATPKSSESPATAVNVAIQKAKATATPAAASGRKLTSAKPTKSATANLPDSSLAVTNAKSATQKKATTKPTAAKSVKASSSETAAKIATKTAAAAPQPQVNEIMSAWTIWQRNVRSSADFWLNFTTKSVRKSADLSRALLAAKNYQEVAAAQQAFAKDALTDVLSEASKIADISAKAASDSQKPLMIHRNR